MSSRNERDNQNNNEEPIDGIGIRGCTDPRASNYNSRATIDDGSCRYVDEAPPPLSGVPENKLYQHIWENASDPRDFYLNYLRPFNTAAGSPFTRDELLDVSANIITIKN